VLTESLEKDVDVKAPAGHLSVKYQLKQARQLIGSYQLDLQFAPAFLDRLGVQCTVNNTYHSFQQKYLLQ